jgi:hypothetical protein
MSGERRQTRLTKGLRVDTSARHFPIVSGDLVDPLNGDIWYNAVMQKFRIRENGISYDLLTSALINLSSDRLLGRDTAGSGAVEELSATGGIEFSGGGAIRIAADGITNAMLANMEAATIKGSIAGGDPANLSGVQVDSITAPWAATRASAIATNIPAPIVRFFLRGHTTEGKGGAWVYAIAAPSPVRPEHFQSADGQWWDIDPNQDVGPMTFGAARDGVTDESAAWNDSWIFVRNKGGRWVAGRGIAMLTSQVTFWLAHADHLGDVANWRPNVADFSGCRIKTTGAISGLKIFGSNFQNPVLFINPQIDHTDNADAVAGIEIAGASGWVIQNPVVYHRGNKVRTKGENDNVGDEGYACYYIRESEAGDPVWAGQPAGLGGYYNAIYHPVAINENGVKGEIGFHIKGTVNQFTVYDGELRDLAVCDLYSNGASGGFVNSARFVFTSFEQCTIVAKTEYTLAATIPYQPIFMHIGCRYEGCGTKWNAGNALGMAPSGSVQFIDDILIDGFSVAEYTSTAIALRPNNSDGGGLGGTYKFNAFFQSIKAFIIRVVSVTQHPLELITYLEKGIAFRYNDFAGAIVGWLGLGEVAADVLKLKSAADSKLDIGGIRTLSSSATRIGKNFKGTVTVSGASTTATNTFTVAEPDVNYEVLFTPKSSTGAPAAGSNRVLGYTTATGNFVVTVEVAPGVGNTQTLSWVIVS